MRASTSGAASRGLFVDANGDPYRIFVEAARIQGRPKFLRDLQRSGAMIAHSPLEADIILVNSTTAEGVSFATDWPDKIVLDEVWAREALDGGVYAPPEQNWGGHRVYPTEPSHASDLNNPLPTPRQTPADDNIPRSSPHIRSPDPPASYSFTQMMIPAPQPQQFRDISFTSPSGHESMARSGPLPYPAQPIQTTLSGEQALAQVVEALRQNGVNLPQPQTLHAPAFVQPPAQYYQAHDWPSQGLSHPSQIHQPLVHMDLASGSTHSTVESISPEPIGHRRTHKRKDSSQAASIFYQEASHDHDYEHTSKQPRLADSDDEALDATTTRSSQKTKHTPNGKVPSRPLFSNDDGESICFYVQPSFRNRQNIVDKIKRFGGKITAEVSEADLVVLAVHADHIESTLRSAMTLDIPVVQSNFINTCIEDNKLLDPEHFSFDGVSVKRKRGAPLVVDLAEMRKNIAVTNHKRASPKRLRKRKGGAKPKPHDSSQSPSQGFNMDSQYEPMQDSPSITMSPGESHPDRSGLTYEEEKFWPRYASHVLKKNTEASVKVLAQGLAKKLPHHSAEFWETEVLLPNLDRIETTREKRRRAAALIREETPSETKYIPPDQSTSQSQIPDPEGPFSTEHHDVQEDLETITQFLAGGGANGLQDDAVWDILASLHPCKSESSWQDIWEKHGSVINTEVERRVASSGAPGGVHYHVKEEPQD